MTHSQAVLPYCDRIVLLKEGKIDFIGTYDQLIEKDVSLKTILGDPKDGEQQGASDRPEEKQEVVLKEAGAQVQSNEEESVVGNVSWKLYLLVIRQIGLLFAGFILALFVAHEICMVSSNSSLFFQKNNLQNLRRIDDICIPHTQVWSMFWLRTWSQDAENRDNDLMEALNDTMHASTADLRENSSLIEKIRDDNVKVAMDYMTESTSPTNRVGVYVLIGSLQLAAALLAGFFLALGVLRISTNFHQSVLNAILRAPLQFFEKTPSGRIVNRMSNDVFVLDMDFYEYLDGWIVILCSIIAVVAVISYEVPALLTVITPCAALFVILLVRSSDEHP